VPSITYLVERREDGGGRRKDVEVGGDCGWEEEEKVGG